MAGVRLIPKGSKLWAARDVGLTTREVIDRYENGFVGAYAEPEEAERLDQLILDTGGYVEGKDAAIASNIDGTGTKQLCIPYVWAMLHFPGCWPGAGQDRGDCVSHCEKNANLLSYACELQENKPDEITGSYEEAPEMPPLGLKQGAFSTEVYYWYRRHGGDGWSCEASAQVAMKEAGLVTRDNHPDLGADLTRYSGKNAGKYGRTPPSGSVADALDNNLIRQATRCRTFEERRDFLYNGYGISTCGSQGFSNTRDKNGVSRKRGSWAHAMKQGGADDREVVKQEYGQPVELVLNSWALWNSGPRDILDSSQYVPILTKMVAARFNMSDEAALQKCYDCDVVNKESGAIMIPKGSFWALSSDWNNRTFIAKSSINGWKRRSISLGLAGNI